MCGRFTLTIDAALLAEVFRLDSVPDHRPRFNIAPTQNHPVIRSSDGRFIASAMRWGLIPSWAKDPAIGSRLINARAETAIEKPSFRSAVRSRRCLIPADGFFEWVAVEGGKQPIHIRRPDRRTFAIAGLWEEWRGSGAEQIESFTILTTQSVPPIARVHHRMPVILSEESWPTWCASERLSPEDYRNLTGPALPFAVEGVAVGRAVNRPIVDDPSVLEASRSDPNVEF